ncbi:MAG: RNA polymerase sigma factor [Acidobacteria bacterium]|nr:RNA polymerase sigma factor [Acidobacteriota bacterium]
MDDDAATIRGAMDGDPDAFRILVERYSRSVFRLAYRLTRSRQDADDIVQEAFLRAYRNLHAFDGRSSFGTWLYRIAANSAFDMMRSAQRHPTEELGERDVPSPVAKEPATQIGIRAAVESAMKLLSGNERTAFVLRHFEGMSIDEISEVLGIEPNAVKNTIFRAVRKLREVLAPLVRPA